MNFFCIQNLTYFQSNSTPLAPTQRNTSLLTKHNISNQSDVLWDKTCQSFYLGFNNNNRKGEKKIAYSNQYEMNISDTKKYKILIKK